jgi:exosortase E/protease (VPEID-CTERM system)
MLLVALLICEAIVFTVRFDSNTVAQTGTWWYSLADRSSLILELLVSAVAGVVLVWLGDTAPGTRTGMGAAWSASRHRGFWPCLLGHLIAVAALGVLTAWLFEGKVIDHVMLPAAWAVTAVAALGLWAGALVPGEMWSPLWHRCRRPVLAGVPLGVVAWSAGRYTVSLWAGPLRWATFWTVKALLGPFTGNLVCQPEKALLGTEEFQVQIASECSGYEGIGLIWVVIGGYLWVSRERLRFPAALLLLPLATVLIWLANAGRIASLIALGTWVSPEMAMGGFHSQAGWLAFNAVALGVVVLSQQSRFFAARDAGQLGSDPTVAFLAPLFAILAVTMVSAAFTTGFDVFYPARVVVAAAALWAFRRHYTELKWTWSWGAFANGVAVFAFWLAMMPATPPPTELKNQLAALPMGWSACWLAFRVIGAVVTVPLAEELAFRGYLTRRLIAPEFRDVPPGRFSWPSFLGSSALFGALHASWAAGVLAGMCYALAYYRRGELSDAVVAHATTNALLAGCALAAGDPSLWV